jgi:hypothetical protein
MGMADDPPPHVVVTPEQGNMDPAQALQEILDARHEAYEDGLKAFQAFVKTPGVPAEAIQG